MAILIGLAGATVAFFAFMWLVIGAGEGAARLLERPLCAFASWRLTWRMRWETRNRHWPK